MVGTRVLAVIDPGPDRAEHVRALAQALEGAEAVSILVTHGHPDHAPGALPLARELGSEVLGPASVAGVTRPLVDGESVTTDEGDLVALETPGHARHHLAFHWPRRAALFAGDLVLGKGDTVWVGEYPGCVADYLRSIGRVRALELQVIYPAHGPPIEDPGEALDRFEAHRQERIGEVRKLLAARPGAGVDELMSAVYGSSLPDGARRAARLAIEALKAHVEWSAE